MKYQKFTIQKGWKYPQYEEVCLLDLDPLTHQCLHAICKWKNVMFTSNNGGLPQALEPQLGYTPTKEDINESLLILQDLGYVEPIKSDKTRGKLMIYFRINWNMITKTATGKNINTLF